jgi:hypothetical protein
MCLCCSNRSIAGSHDNFGALADELQLFEQENDLDEHRDRADPDE